MATLSQTLTQKLGIKLSPQQIQGIKLLELPTALLETRIKEELEENPVLEEKEPAQDINPLSSAQSEPTEAQSEPKNTSLEEYLKIEEASSTYKMRSNNFSTDDREPQSNISQGKSLTQWLTEQLLYCSLSAKQQLIANFVIGTLDDDGYLRRDDQSILDDLAFTGGLDVQEDELQEVISIIQTLEPAGVGARTLSESLLIQLSQSEHPNSASRHAVRILKEFFVEFTKKHYDKICTRMGISKDQLRDALELIKSLNPKPANGYNEEGVDNAPVIIPDFILDYNQSEDIFDLQLSTNGLPELRINNTYARMAQEVLETKNQSQSQREALGFIRGKIESARWFIAAIKQRQETLMHTMRVILEFQKEYFKEGEISKLRPMILKDIALKTGFDISTISRVVNSKYIRTHFGVFLLKTLFSEGVLNETGEEVSTIEVKRILREFVDQEDPRHPLTDENLMTMLADRGFRIARRTVAKYREMMEIPVARLRKGL